MREKMYFYPVRCKDHHAARTQWEINYVYYSDAEAIKTQSSIISEVDGISPRLSHRETLLQNSPKCEVLSQMTSSHLDHTLTHTHTWFHCHLNVPVRVCIALDEESFTLKSVETATAFWLNL